MTLTQYLYSTISTNIDTIINNFTSSGFTVEGYEEKEISGMTLIEIKVIDSSGVKILAAYAKISDAYVGVITVYNQTSGEYETEKFEEVAKIEKENSQKDINDPDYMSSEDINAAAINAQISETQIESMAIKYADDCVRQAQPSSRKADLAPLFKQNSEAWKALLQFQTSLNVIWQNIKYDIPYAVKNKAYGRIVGIISGYVIAGILMNFVTEGIGGGDDDEREAGALRDLLYYSTTQFTDAVPIIGSAISQANKKIITGKSDFIGQGSDLTPMISKFIQASQQAVKGDWTKAAGKTAEGFALATGLPVSGAKEALKVFGVGDKDGSFSLHLEALLSRDIEEK